MKYEMTAAAAKRIVDSVIGSKNLRLADVIRTLAAENYADPYNRITDLIAHWHAAGYTDMAIWLGKQTAYELFWAKEEERRTKDAIHVLLNLVKNESGE